MINYKEFEVLNTVLHDNANTPESIYADSRGYVFKNVAEVADIVGELEKKRFIFEWKLTSLGMEQLEPYRVKNAVILAAGGSDISAKSTYAIPKGLFLKNGETIIERQIRQLQEVGIFDITVVIAYKQELYFFLQDKWNVNLEVNPDLSKNNIYSLYIARRHLSNTYICNCDNYFVQNPFSAFEYNSYHATVYKNDPNNELVIKKNLSGRILEVYSGVQAGECLYGHAYIDSQFSKRFNKFLCEEISNFRISSLFWEEFMSKHVSDLDMYAREYSDEVVFEFDKIQQIQNIDSLFLNSVSGRINQKICEVLQCAESDIIDISILQKGLTNILFTFVVRGQKYIFRYPGDSSEFFIYRKNECVAQKLAAMSHADDTYIYIDESGIKISKFRENCHDLYGIYYHDIELMKKIAAKLKNFHDSGYAMSDWKEYEYSPIYQCERLFKEASKIKGDLFVVFDKEWKMIRKLKRYADLDQIPHTMCHNDINIDNVLLTDDTLDIIDWEFAGYNDPGYDFGRIIAGLEYEVDEPKIKIILESYFGRPATQKEYVHWMAYSAIHNWYYVGWALYKESINESSRDWMLFFFKQAKKLANWCLAEYYNIYGKIDK